MEKIIELRKKLKEEALKKARIFAECVRKIGKVTVIVFGSIVILDELKLEELITQHKTSKSSN